MGADFDCAWIPDARLDEGRIKKLLELAAREEPDEWDDRCDSAEECRDWIVEAIKYLANVPNMGTSFVKVPGADFAVILSGGESGGGWDLPDINREMFEILDRHAPAVVEQLAQWAKEEWRAVRQGSVAVTVTNGEEGEWQALGSVTVDSGRLLLIDPIHGGVDLDEVGEYSGYLNHPLTADDDRWAVLIGTPDAPVADNGGYTVDVRYVDSPSGRHIAEIRVRFVDDNGDSLAQRE